MFQQQSHNVSVSLLGSLVQRSVTELQTRQQDSKFRGIDPLIPIAALPQDYTHYFCIRATFTAHFF